MWKQIVLGLFQHGSGLSPADGSHVFAALESAVHGVLDRARHRANRQVFHTHSRGDRASDY